MSSFSKFLVSALLLFSSVSLHAQWTEIAGVVNTYSAVTDINPCENSVTVDNPSAFTYGDRALLIQMQGATVLVNNDANFGSLVDYGAAGNFELVTIGNVAGNTVTLQNNLTRPFVAGNAVQLVKVPRYKNVRITGRLMAKPWDGKSGGIIACEVNDTIELSASIDASGAGFLGGMFANGSWSCSQMEYFNESSNQDGQKGQGIASVDTQLYGRARGALANGGGGGNNHNAGGAGGANAGSGGDGGMQWGTCDIKVNGGIGGWPLTDVSSRNILVMGGGGGAGHANGPTGNRDPRPSSSGASGGGIVMLRGRVLRGNGSILANGASQETPTTGDGAGGGGAGGTVLLDVEQVNSKIRVEVNGGNGGNVIPDADCYGPGGGGGGGLFLTTGASVSPNLSVAATGGIPGALSTMCHPNLGPNYGATRGQPGSYATGFSIWEAPPGGPAYLPVLSALPGDTISVPIMLASRPGGTSGSYPYQAKVSFNKELLVPLGATPAGYTQNGLRSIDVNSSWADTSATLSSLKFLVILATTDTSALRLDSFAWKGTQCADGVVRVNGKLEVGICTQGNTPRFVQSGAVLLKTMRPNPVSQGMEIAFTTLEDGRTELYITDIFGARVASLVNADLEHGEHTAILDVTSLVPGTYLCILQTPTKRLTNEIRVVR